MSIYSKMTNRRKLLYFSRCSVLSSLSFRIHFHGLGVENAQRQNGNHSKAECKTKMLVTSTTCRETSLFILQSEVEVSW